MDTRSPISIINQAKIDAVPLAAQIERVQGVVDHYAWATDGFDGTRGQAAALQAWTEWSAVLQTLRYSVGFKSMGY